MKQWFFWQDRITDVNRPVRIFVRSRECKKSHLLWDNILFGDNKIRTKDTTQNDCQNIGYYILNLYLRLIFIR